MSKAHLHKTKCVIMNAAIQYSLVRYAIWVQLGLGVIQGLLLIPAPQGVQVLWVFMVNWDRLVPLLSVHLVV